MNLTSARPLLLGASVTIAAVSLSGCSMVASLTPVAGDNLSSVRTATTDVLLAEKYEILLGPDCDARSKTEVACTGKVAGAGDFSATADSANEFVMTVKVGEKLVYSGPVNAVLDKAGRVN